MGLFTIKKYKTIKDENGNKIQVPKTKEEWNKETKNGTAIYYFSDRYKINNKSKQYRSANFKTKRESSLEESLFLLDPIEYIKNSSKIAAKRLELLESTQIPSEDDKKLLEEYFNDFLESYSFDVKPATIYEYSEQWENHIRDEFENLSPEDITLPKIIEFKEKINQKINPKTKEPYSVSTKNKIWAALVVFLNYLIGKGKLELNYASVVKGFKKIKTNKNEKKEIRYQTLEEFELFMSIVDDIFWYIFFNFLFWHGPRKGEQRALKIKYVKIIYDIIKFKETFSKSKTGGEMIGPIKNGKEREIYLAEQSKPYIEKLLEIYKHMPGYSEEWFLFGGPIPLSRNKIDNKLNEYYDKLERLYPDKKIRRLTHHEFGRHSHASFLLNVGCDREDIYQVIADRLGDTVEVIKSTYAKPYKKSNFNKSKNLLTSENINSKLL